MPAKPLANIIPVFTEIVTQTDFDGKINRLKIVINIPDKNHQNPKLPVENWTYSLDSFVWLNPFQQSQSCLPLRK